MTPLPPSQQSGSWDDADDRARAVQEARNALREHLGISTDGLTDDEVLVIFNRRMAQAAGVIRAAYEKFKKRGEAWMPFVDWFDREFDNEEPRDQP